MKKIISTILLLLSASLQGFAQQYINLYQDDVVIKQYSTEEIDSMSISETEPRIVSFWRDGSVFQTYNAADIDSIKVSNRGGAPFSYIGIVGFNSQLQTKDIGILSPTTASQYKSFVNNLPKRDGTILYYAVDNALDMLDDAHIESPLKSVNVITFTDGLDQGSIVLTDKYSSSAAYLDALGKHIAQTKDSELSPNFYALGLRGSDVSDMSQFRQNLQRLASSADNVFEVSSISDLHAKFQDIANQIISISTRQSMSVRIIGVETGTRMRFVFDGKSAANSELYIEGTFDLQDRSLHDVTYHGIKATSGKTLQGTQDGIFFSFTFTGMRLDAGTSLIPTSSVKHYYMSPSSTSWQANSEFTPTGNTQRNVSHSGTLIFLVLDCSSSLGSDFSRMQQYANEFIDLIANNAEPFERLLSPTKVKAEADVKDEKFLVNVSWDAVKYAQSYKVYRSSSSSGTYELVAEGVTSTTWTDDRPLKGYNYYKVCAISYGFTSSQSSYTSVDVSLAAPTNVKAEVDVKDEKIVVNVSWDAVKYAQSYKVYRSSSSSGTYELVAEGVTSTTWTDDSPLKGDNYYKVCAIGYGFTSSQSSYTSVYVSLAAPTNVKAEKDEKDLVVNVSWDAVKYAQSYKVYRSSSYKGTYELVAEGVTSTTWTDDSPLKGDNYYKVCAIGYGFTSSQSSYEYVYVSLATPANVKAEIDEKDLVVNVSWDAVKYAQSYKVYRSSSYSGTYSLVAEGVTSTTWTDDSPLKGDNYYKVCAVNRNITSSQSSYTSVYVSLAAPTNVKAEKDEKDLVVNVSWDAVKYAQSYKVYRSSSSSGTYELVAEGVTSTTWTDDSPLKGYNYYKVCAVAYGFTSSQSSYTSVNVSLAAPTNVKAEVDVKDEKFLVNVSWDAVKYAQSYKIYRSSSSNGTYELIAENIPSTTWTDLTTLYGNSYYYKVCSKNRNVVSSQSSYTSVNVSLAAPTNAKAEVDVKDEKFLVNVSWDAVKYAQSYKVYRSSSYKGTYELVAEGVTSTTWTDDSPLKGDNYYKVCAIGYGFTSSQSYYTSVNVSLATPTNVKAEIDEKDLAVNVSWDAVKYAQSYKVYRSSSSSGTYSLVAEGVTSTTWTDDSPLKGSNYYKVCAVNRNITSSQSSYTSVNVSLAAPTNVKAEVDVKGEKFLVNVSWDAVKYAQSYKIYRSSSSNGTYELIAENIPSTTWTDLTTLYGNSYYYKVCAKNRNVVSSQSSYTSVNVSLAAPTNVKAEIDVKDEKFVVNVSWDAVKYAQSYKVYRSSSSIGTGELIADNIPSTTWTDPTALYGNSYYYKVCAKNRDVVSSQSSYTSVNVSLAAPTNVKAEIDVKDEKFVFNVSWDAVKSAQSYKVYRSSSSKGTYSLVAEGVTSTTWTDDSPLKGYNYYKVCAVGYGFTSSQSSYTSVNVSLAAPTNVKAEKDEKDLVVNVSWDAVKYAQSYKVYRSSSSNGTYSLVAEGVTSTTWTDDRPLKGYNYYKVCAVGYGFTSSQSSYTSVNVSLAAPTNVKAEKDEKDLVVNVSWDAVKYAQSYKVYRSSSSNGTYSLVAEGVTSTTWTDDSPLKGYNYYKVCAVGYGFTSSQSSYTSVNVSLAAPTNVKAEVDVKDEKFVVNVSWSAVKYAQSYNVYRYSSYSGTDSLVAEGVTSTTWTDDSPQEGYNYYKVCAVGYGFTSSQSPYASVIVSFSVPTNAKAEVDVMDEKFLVNVSWSAVKYAQSYNVYRSSSGYSDTYSLVAEGVSSTTWTDYSPLNGNNYT